MVNFLKSLHIQGVSYHYGPFRTTSVILYYDRANIKLSNSLFQLYKSQLQTLHNGSKQR